MAQFIRRVWRLLSRTQQQPASNLPEIIYRVVSTSTPKGVSLHSGANYQTGLSFMEEQPASRKYLAYKTSILIAHNYIVKPDGEQIAVNVWTNKPYIEPNSESTIQYPEGHVSVWHQDHNYWYDWHWADAASTFSTDPAIQKLVSPQLAAFFALRDENLSVI